MILEYGVAGVIRYLLLKSSYMQSIADRVEVSTPINSWKRVLEGAYLYKEGIDPYEGDMFHESPLFLVGASWLITNFPSILPALFVMFDLITAYTLSKTAKLFSNELIERQEKNKHTYAKDILQSLLKPEQLDMVPIYVATVYLFNPYTVLSCVGMTTTVFTNLFLAVGFYSMIKGWRFLSCLTLALASVQTMYSFMLIIPASMYISKKAQINCKMCSSVRTAFVFLICVVGLIGVSYYITGSWRFLEATYGFILNVPDLRPNIGLFWYFFTEMFEHFRSLFISSFQINATMLYVVPLSLRLRDEPMLLATSLTALVAIFKSYPSLGDVGFYLALLPMWKHLFNYMQQGFIVGCFFLITSILAPTVWHLWIYSRSANANFFFGVTLAFATAQIFLVTDILFAYIKREFSLKNGMSRQIDGEPAKLVLE